MKEKLKRLIDKSKTIGYKKYELLEDITSVIRDLDPIETTTSYIWLSIWEWAGVNKCLVPFVANFSIPKIPSDKVEECAKYVKSHHPTTSYYNIMKSILEFV